MTAPQWTPSLSVGHDVLDTHHQHLFALLQELTSRLATTPDETWARDLGARLLDYMDYHFGEEEAVLEAAGFPFLQFHKASHQAIAMRTHRLLDGLGQRPPAEVMAEIRDFLADWLSHHIEIEDFEYRPYVTTAG